MTFDWTAMIGLDRQLVCALVAETGVGTLEHDVSDVYAILRGPRGEYLALLRFDEAGELVQVSTFAVLKPGDGLPPGIYTATRRFRQLEIKVGGYGSITTDAAWLRRLAEANANQKKNQAPPAS